MYSWHTYALRARRTRVVFLTVSATLMAGCGARSGLLPGTSRLDVVTVDASEPDAPAVLDAPLDTATDTPTDVPPRCTELVTLIPATPLLTTMQGSYVTPRVVARGDGFDVLGPLSNGEVPGIRSRRFSVRGTPPMLSAGEIQLIGHDSFTWAEAATDGNLLGICFAGSSTGGGPQLRILADSYTWRSSTAVALPPAVSSCRGLAWSGERWVSAWARADDSQPGPHIVAFERLGLMAGMALPALAGIDRGSALITSYGSGAAWAVPVNAGAAGFDVVFAARGAPERRVHVNASGRVLQLAPWPVDPRALAAVVIDTTASIHLLVIRDDGTMPVRREVIAASPRVRRSTVMSAFGDGVVIANVTCSGAVMEPGRVDLLRYGADGSQRGGAISVPVSCVTSPTIASVAASASQIAVVWMEPRPTGNGDTDVVGAVFGCGP